MNPVRKERLAGILFIISAPSGSGKSTLVNQLRSLVDNLEFSISYTTRNPRGSEQQGREYHFTDRAHFEQMIAEDEFLEHAEVFGNYYGTAWQSLRDAEARGKDLLLDIDVQGAAQVRKNIPDAGEYLRHASDERRPRGAIAKSQPRRGQSDRGNRANHRAPARPGGKRDCELSPIWLYFGQRRPRPRSRETGGHRLVRAYSAKWPGDDSRGTAVDRTR